LNIEKKFSSTHFHKVSAVERRIEFLLENEVNGELHPNDKLRHSLNELLKENDSIKR
jgi:hypothetical protein